MDLGNTQLAGLISSNQQEEKAKYNIVASKIKMTSGLIRNVYGKTAHTKLIQNDYGKIIITSQPSLIFENAKVNHPLVQLLHEFVKKMDVIGDCSSFFVLLAADMVSETLSLVERGVKPALIANAYREVYKEVEKFCEGEKISHKIDFDDEGTITKVIQGVIKDPILSRLVSKAVSQTKSFDTENIRICKIASGSVEDSYTVEGMVFERAPEGEIKSVSNATTSIYNCPIDITRTELKSTILMKTAEDLLSYSKNEGKGIKQQVDSLQADVIIPSSKVDKIYLDFLNKNKKLVFKILSRHDLRRIRELIGGQISQVLAPQEKESMGYVDEVSTFTEGNITFTKFVSRSRNVYTLVIRNSVQAILDEQERLIQKALTTLKKNTIDSNIHLVKGAGHFEQALSQKFHQACLDFTDEKHLVYKCLSSALALFKTHSDEVFDIFNGKLKAIHYAIDFLATLFETSDYLIGKPQKLDIAPRMNEHWDEDH